MHCLVRCLLLFCLLMACWPFAFGQVAGNVAQAGDECIVVGEVLTQGNRHTRNRIIIRELDIFPGDTLCPGDRQIKLSRNEKRVYNTLMFNKVTIEFISDSVLPVSHLVVRVEERWYLFPRPLFELADRNFNEWWQDRGRRLNRVDLGGSVSHRNLTGHNDRLKLKAHAGFTHKYELFYNTPYLGPGQNDRLNFGVSYSTNNEAAYRTFNDKLEFVRPEKTARTRFYAKGAYARRTGFFTSTAAELEYVHNTINDTIALLNPDYFLNGNTIQQFLAVNLNFTYDSRDVRAYAHKGSVLRIGYSNRGGLYNNGFEMNMAYISMAGYKPLGGPFYYAGSVNASAYRSHRVPYNFSNAQGFGQYFVRGYDLYVIDGPGTAFSRNTLRLQLYAKEFDISPVMPLKQFSKVPTALYFNVFGDAGYVEQGNFNQMNPRLKNTLLAGWGAGIDLVTFYDLVWRFEYSFNKLGESSFFFHIETDI